MPRRRKCVSNKNDQSGLPSQRNEIKDNSQSIVTRSSRRRRRILSSQDHDAKVDLRSTKKRKTNPTVKIGHFSIFFHEAVLEHNKKRRSPETPNRIALWHNDAKSKSSDLLSCIAEFEEFRLRIIKDDIEKLQKMLKTMISSFENFLIKTRLSLLDLDDMYDKFIIVEKYLVNSTSTSKMNNLITPEFKKIADRYLFSKPFEIEYLVELVVKAHCCKKNNQKGLSAEMPFDAGSLLAILVTQRLIVMSVSDLYANQLYQLFLVRPPSHHAGILYDNESKEVFNHQHGFCYVNNIFKAVELLYKKNKNSRILILDMDLHHGDGTLSLLDKMIQLANVGGGRIMMLDYYMPDIFPFHEDGYLKTYQENIKKCKNNYIPLKLKGREDIHKYIGPLKIQLKKLKKTLNPEVVIISLGFDTLAGHEHYLNLEHNDKHATQLKPNDFVVIMYAIYAIFGEILYRVFMEGGYDPELLKECINHVAGTMKAFKSSPNQELSADDDEDIDMDIISHSNYENNETKEHKKYNNSSKNNNINPYKNTFFVKKLRHIELKINRVKNKFANSYDSYGFYEQFVEDNKLVDNNGLVFSAISEFSDQVYMRLLKGDCQDSDIKKANFFYDNGLTYFELFNIIKNNIDSVEKYNQLIEIRYMAKINFRQAINVYSKIENQKKSIRAAEKQITEIDNNFKIISNTFKNKTKLVNESKDSSDNNHSSSNKLFSKRKRNLDNSSTFEQIKKKFDPTFESHRLYDALEKANLLQRKDVTKYILMFLNEVYEKLLENYLKNKQFQPNELANYFYNNATVYVKLFDRMKSNINSHETYINIVEIECESRRNFQQAIDLYEETKKTRYKRSKNKDVEFAKRSIKMAKDNMSIMENELEAILKFDPELQDDSNIQHGLNI